MTTLNGSGVRNAVSGPFGERGFVPGDRRAGPNGGIELDSAGTRAGSARLAGACRHTFIWAVAHCDASSAASCAAVCAALLWCPVLSQFYRDLACRAWSNKGRHWMNVLVTATFRSCD